METLREDSVMTMRKNYNHTRRKLYLPEYGRHIQEMVDPLLEIEGRGERTRQAKAVIAVMGNLNPLLRDTAEVNHKLWDHLFIMSDFRLDVDSPYSRPSREDLAVKPEKLEYPQSNISHKHYGKNITSVLRKLKSESPEHIDMAMGDVVRYLRNKSLEYNQEHPTKEMIINDIKILSEGCINLDEERLKSVEMEHKSAVIHQRAPKRQQRQQQKQQKGTRKNGQRHNTQK
jgi:hypothetical protein